MYCRSCLLATSESAISGNSDSRSIIFHPRLPRDQRGNGLLTKAQPVHDYFLPTSSHCGVLEPTGQVTPKLCADDPDPNSFSGAIAV